MHLCRPGHPTFDAKASLRLHAVLDMTHTTLHHPGTGTASGQVDWQTLLDEVARGNRSGGQTPP
jgi:hypothetical protein